MEIILGQSFLAAVLAKKRSIKGLDFRFDQTVNQSSLGVDMNSERCFINYFRIMK